MLTPGHEIEELTAIRQHTLTTRVLALDEHIAGDMLLLIGALPDDVAIVRITDYRAAPTAAHKPASMRVAGQSIHQSDAETDGTKGYEGLREWREQTQHERDVAELARLRKVLAERQLR